MEKIIQQLSGGDLRSIGKSNQVAKKLLKEPALIRIVVSGMFCDDPIIRSRCADTLEKVASEKPEHVERHKKVFFGKALKAEQQEVRWHVAQIFSHIKTTENERKKIIPILTKWLKNEKSRIVQVSCLQTLSDFSMVDKRLRPRVYRLLNQLKSSPTASLRARAKRILKEMEVTANG